MIPDVVFFGIRECDMTMSQVIAEMDRLQSEHPELEVFMDGEAYAVVGRCRVQGVTA